MQGKSQLMIWCCNYDEDRNQIQGLMEEGYCADKTLMEQKRF